MAKKYYVVWEGKRKGVFATWDECKESVTGVKGAVYKSFESLSEATNAFRNYDKKQMYAKNFKSTTTYAPTQTNFIVDSLSVDAACSGNPGKMEYRGVHVKTGQEVFRVGPYEDGTNNIGEFLALVHGLSFLKKHNSNIPIYSDSITAIGWVQKKMCNTKLEETSKNDVLFDLIDRAETWLKTNTYTTKIYKWETKIWGEIPADFGRK